MKIIELKKITQNKNIKFLKTLTHTHMAQPVHYTQLFFCFDINIFPFSITNNKFCFYTTTILSSTILRLRNDRYCVGWGVKLYSLTCLVLLNRFKKFCK